MPQSLQGKSGIIMGVANHRSIAAGIAEILHSEGAQLGFSYLPDKSGKMETRVKKATEQYEPKIIKECDVNSDSSVENFFAEVEKVFGKIDFLVHSIAYAPVDDIRCPTIECSREGFLSAMETSVYSFILTARFASRIMPNGGSVLTLSYYGGEKVIPGYNLMGVAKSSLEMSVQYLASDLGSQNIRVNAISAGAIKTLASSAIGQFGQMLKHSSHLSPLQKNPTTQDVGMTAAFLLGDQSQCITGDIIHVDCGCHVMGASPAL